MISQILVIFFHTTNGLCHTCIIVASSCNIEGSLSPLANLNPKLHRWWKRDKQLTTIRTNEFCVYKFIMMMCILMCQVGMMREGVLIAEDAPAALIARFRMDVSRDNPAPRLSLPDLISS